MTTRDNICTITPYFQVAKGKTPAFKALCRKMVEQTKAEPGCLYYGFTFDGNNAHCREGYADAKSLLTHIKQVGPLLDQALKISRLVRLEVHGPKTELAKLRKPLAGLKPEFYTLVCGFKRTA